MKRNLSLAISLTTTVLLLCTCRVQAQTRQPDLLEQSIRQIIDTAGAHIGVGIKGLDFEASLQINGSDAFPMQSVFKFPLALAVLKQADQGRLSLNTRIPVRRKELDQHTWSPLLRDSTRAEFSISIRELLRYTVSKSDNNTCDILFRLAGGTAKVQAYVQGLGITGIQIKATEAGMKKAWNIQYTNSCRPGAMLELLQRFYAGSLLSPAGNRLLLQLMTETENSPKRLKGQLPGNAVIAHKTGTSDTNAAGLTAAINDAGIITLPDGRHMAMVVYVSDYKGGVTGGERIIAAISRLAWDFYSK